VPEPAPPRSFFRSTLHSGGCGIGHGIVVAKRL
jgi:hypothetical protein